MPSAQVLLPWSTRSKALCALVGALALCFGIASARAQPGGDAAAPDVGLKYIQEAVTAGFARSDPDRLAATLSQKMKTYVSCRPVDVTDGYYGADQMRLFFRRMFRTRQTIRFRISEPALAPRPDGRAIAIAEWSYRENGGTSGQDHIAFTLGLDAGAWRVREIRDLK